MTLSVWTLYSFNTYLLNISPAQDIVLDVVDPGTDTCAAAALVELGVQRGSEKIHRRWERRGGAAKGPSARLSGSSLAGSLTLSRSVTEASTEVTSKFRTAGQVEVMRL